MLRVVSLLFLGYIHLNCGVCIDNENAFIEKKLKFFLTFFCLVMRPLEMGKLAISNLLIC